MRIRLVVGTAVAFVLFGAAFGAAAEPASDPPATITFAPLADKTFGDGDFTVTATSSDGGSVSFAASGQCTVTGSTVHITGAGSCTVTASEGAATPVSRSFAIAKAAQTITFDLPDGTAAGKQLTVHATASSGLPVAYRASRNCTINGAVVHLGVAGLCTITASQAGNADYNPATPVSRTFTIETSLAPACKARNLAGETITAAKRALARAGCSVGVVTYTYSSHKRGTVVSQRRFADGISIDVVVSSGPAPKAVAEAVVTGRCTRLTARLLLARFRRGDLGDPRLRDPVGKLLCGAFAGRRSNAMAVTLAIPTCGGTAGWAVFRWNGRAWTALLERADRLQLSAVGSSIRETTPVFQSGDGRCSPTGGKRSRLWRWNGTRLVAGPWKRALIG